MLHLYVMVGLIPVTAIIFCANVFIGPAQLTPIPEGCNPKHWEYHRHPITRFIARYIHNSPQQVTFTVFKESCIKFNVFIGKIYIKMQFTLIRKWLNLFFLDRDGKQQQKFVLLVNEFIQGNTSTIPIFAAKLQCMHQCVPSLKCKGAEETTSTQDLLFAPIFLQFKAMNGTHNCYLQRCSLPPGPQLVVLSDST